MVEEVLQYMTQYHMVEPGDVVITGVSGGADSVCLLLVLQKLAAELSISIEAVHINHGIRTEAAGDAEFVRRLCEDRGIPFHLVCADVETQAKQEKMSTEEMGRKIRYEAFRQILGERKGRIAVAHNSNDRAETMLFHLFRGTGLAGVCGIRPVQGEIIRPLLFLERKEIEQWLQEQGISFCTDATNLGDDYTRNRIRHHILPYAEEEIVHGATANMNRAAKQLQEADEYVMRQTLAAVERCCIFTEHPKAASVKLSLLQKEDPFIQKRLLFYTVCEIAGRKKDITEAHIQSIYKLLQGTGSKECMLPYQVHVYKQYEWVKIEKSEAERGISQAKYMELPELPVDIPSVVDVPGLGRVEFRTFPCEKSQIIPQKTYTKWFDYDKITRIMCLRPRQAGDYLTVNQQMGRKSLQDYFVDQKIPKENRNSLYVLAMDHHVVWVPGLRISEYFKITEQTEHVLQVKVLSKELDK
jgi:tRNA(Ile)-lysidine synthase